MSNPPPLAQHFIRTYSCGHIQEQCRCADLHKTKVALPHPCPSCIRKGETQDT